MLESFDKPLSGIITPLATPLLDDGTLDVTAFGKLIDHVVGGGVSGLFVLGTTGEAASLSWRLRADVIRSACAQAAGRVPVLAGISDTSQVESLRLADMARECGAHSIVMAPPYYLLYSQSDLLAYIESISRECTLPLFLYNIPPLTKIAYEPDLVRQAAEIPGVAGIKDSSGDPEYLRAILPLVRHRPDFRVFIGPEHMLLDALLAGAHGGVCGGSNLDPLTMVQLYRAVQSGDIGLARRLQAQVDAMGAAIYSTGDASTAYLRGLKHALSLTGIGNGRCAPPLREFAAEEKAQIAARLNDIRAARSPATEPPTGDPGARRSGK